MLHLRIRLIIISCAACAFGACQQDTSSSAPGAAGASTETHAWVKNGGAACDRYLTPDLIGAIFKDASGQSHQQDSQACTFEAAHQPNTDYSTISIYLRDGGDLVFDGDPMTKNGTPLQGVGDKAVRTQEDGVQAVKGEHICSIFVKPPFGHKLKGDAMAQKLGEVCNKLFTLP